MTALHAAVHCCEDSSKLRRRISNEEASDNVSHEFHDRTEIKKKHIEIVRLLCNAGARVNCKDSKNLTPLHYACRSNSEVIWKCKFKIFCWGLLVFVIDRNFRKLLVFCLSTVRWWIRETSTGSRHCIFVLSTIQ